MTAAKRKAARAAEPGKQNGAFFDPMAVTWTEKYNKTISRYWDKLPQGLGRILATVAVFVLGISINGDWMAIFVHLSRQLGYHTPHADITSGFSWSEVSLESLRLKNLGGFWIGSMAVSYGMYLLIGGFLHWYYYVRQRDTPELWKCQPEKWLSPELERHEIILGSLTLFLNATSSSIMACYIANGGYSTVYYKFDEYGWFWLFLSIPVLFIYQDYVTYWLHRLYHFPFLYKRFHKLHHKYKQPTAFSVTAIHPVESTHIQLTLALPLFVMPIHWLAFYFVVIYTYYHGIIDHSGVNFKALWWQPWQPDAIFHDNHHQYFHVNFAFNIQFWDKLHGTYRRKDRVYTEDTFYGVGKGLDQVSEEELKADLENRRSENRAAYRDNVYEFELSKNELKKLKKKPKKQVK